MIWADLATLKLEALLNGIWVDISVYLIVGDRGQDVQCLTGRQTELQQIDPSSMSLVLENRDGRFTPNNTASPYWPYWTQGTQLRVTETIGARSFAFPDMWLEFPEVALTFEDPTDSTNTDRAIRVNAVDLLTRLNRAPRFLSNLAAYISSRAKTSLVAFWPLVDAQAEPFANTRGTPVARTIALTSSTVTYDNGVAVAIPRGGTTLPGDDLPGLRFEPEVRGGATVLSRQLGAIYDGPFPTMTAGQVLTMACWVDLDVVRDEANSLMIVTTFDGPAVLTKNASTDSPASVMRFTKPIGTVTGSVNSSLYPSGPGPHLIGIRLGLTPNVIELWINRQVYTGTLTGSLSSTGVSEVFFAGNAFQGSLAHCQLYIGTDYTNDDFVAQYEAGIGSLDGQSVDQRIRAACNYAGISDAQLELEASDTPMPPPAFGGSRPGAAASAAADTGGGILFTRGPALIYHDRKHRFNL